MRLAPLPIDGRLPDVVAALEARGSVVVVAEPGAGKTTRVPRALLDRGTAERGEILVLEPRRIAARLAARRVAAELGEAVGGTIGYQVRFEQAASARTRVRFITEGILTRRLASDPTLRGVAAVVLDELHERSIHTDLALALLRRLRERERPDLLVLAMSATMDAAPVAAYLGCDVVASTGRAFEVAVEHADKPDDRPLERQVAAAVRRLVADGLDGDVLVFLPGAAEIRRAREACEGALRAAGIELAMLHGDLPPDEQDRAVRPGDRPKVILSTNVAETSVTIPGVVAVVDSGLARFARHSPWSGLPSLVTGKISQASATQRAGRAGRTRAGRCLRLYPRQDLETRAPFDEPEIRTADLTELVLVLRSRGEEPETFPFFERPRPAALAAAGELLERLGAVRAGQITELGRRMLELPVHPRLARLALEADGRGAGARGTLLAALVGEREIRLAARTRFDAGQASSDDVGASDLIARLEAFEDAEADGLRADAIRRRELDVGATLAVRRARDQLVRAIGCDALTGVPIAEDEETLLVATLVAFPDRVARRRAPRSADVFLAGGGTARLAPASVVKEAMFLCAVEADERPGGAVVRAASAVEPEMLLELYAERIAERRELRFDPTSEQVECVTELAYDGLVLDAGRDRDVHGPDVSRVLADAVLAAGPAKLFELEEVEQLAVRLAFAAAHGLDVPAPGDDPIPALVRELCEGRRSFAELRSLSLAGALRARIAPAALGRLARFAPETVSIAGRPRVPVRWERGKDPFIESRLQDFFGMRDGPRVADGRVPLVLHLLAPNRRAVQVTTDLAGFWTRHYPELRRSLMRRYPRHAWPENPLA